MSRSISSTITNEADNSRITLLEGRPEETRSQIVNSNAKSTARHILASALIAVLLGIASVPSSALAAGTSSAIDDQAAASDEQPALSLVKALVGLIPRQFGLFRAEWCECVRYGNNILASRGISRITGDAWTWGSSLRSRGFSENNTPRSGDFAVIPRISGFPRGHVGIVNSFSVSGGRVSINLRGAHQTGPEFTHYDCTNVSYTSYSSQQTGVYKFYRR